jgi:hypothetical protein
VYSRGQPEREYPGEASRRPERKLEKLTAVHSGPRGVNVLLIGH